MWTATAGDGFGLSDGFGGSYEANGPTGQMLGTSDLLRCLLFAGPGVTVRKTNSS